MVRGAAVVGALAVVVGLGQAAAGPGWQVGGSYRVARGDTLWALSQRFGVTVSTLAAANGLADPNRIEAGTTLMIPGPSPAATASVASVAPAASPGGGGGGTGSGVPAGLASRAARMSLVPSFLRAAQDAGISASLLEAISWQESGWQAGVVSSAGALGVGQLTPATVTFVNQVLSPQPLDPAVAADNIELSARFLRYLLDQTGWDVRQAVAAYYQGLASVQTQGVFPGTRHYVDNVLALQAEF
ncbi:MAG: lytic transglycosylase domain-containing protein [Acidimicrobiales bacterium]